MKLVDSFKQLFRRKKKREEIPKYLFECPKCGKLKKKEKSVIALPEGVRICEDCYWKYAELFKGQRPKFSSLPRCSVCGKEAIIACKAMFCRECCLNGFCSHRKGCLHFENMSEVIVKNPSRRASLDFNKETIRRRKSN
jgi:hypothetical protein